MTFMTPITLSVPVMSRVQKYVQVNYPAGLIISSQGDPLQFYVWSMIQTEKVRIRTYGRLAKPLTDTIDVQVSQCNQSRRQVLLNETEIRMFNKTVDTYLFQEFYRAAAHRQGVTLEQTIFRFLERYQLKADELLPDTMKQSFLRFSRSGEIGFSDNLLRETVLPTALF